MTHPEYRKVANRPAVQRAATVLRAAYREHYSRATASSLASLKAAEHALNAAVEHAIYGAAYAVIGKAEGRS